MNRHSGEIVREIRKKLGLSLRKLAEKVGVSASLLSLWENNISEPSDRVARAVAQALDIDFESFRIQLEKERYIREQAKTKTKFREILTSDITYPVASPHPRFISEKVESYNIHIPVLGSIPAEKPIEVTLQTLTQAEDYISLPSDIVTKAGRLFVLRVNGDSMTGRINEGEYAVVDPDIMPENGDIAVLVFNGEATIKEFRRVSGGVLLQSPNPKIEPIYIRHEDDIDFRIIGKVVIKVSKSP